ncbi:hypothetical protein D3C75_512650 [compost metagenome]
MGVGVEHICHGVKPSAVIAIPGHRKVSAGGGEVFAIAHPQGAAMGGFLLLHLRFCRGHVHRKRPPVADVFPGAERQSIVILAGLDTAIGGDVVRQAVDAGALQERGFLHAVVIAAIVPAGQAVFKPAFTLQNRHRGVRHHEVLLAAVGLFDGHVQIAAAAGRIEIVNLERAGGDIVLIDHVAILAHYHLGVAVSHAANTWGEALQAVRQHVIVRGDLRPGKCQAVKYVRGGGALPEGDDAAQRQNVALGIAVDRGEVALRRAIVPGLAPCGVGAQTPGSEVQPRTQVQIIIALVATVFPPAAAILGGVAVVQQ